MAQTIDYPMIVDCIRRHPHMFSNLSLHHQNAFYKWLPKNAHVVHAFWCKAFIIKFTRQRMRYSAYTIREVLRWESDLRENGSEYKLSNNNTPFISRLVMMLDPRLKGLFATHG